MTMRPDFTHLSRRLFLHLVTATGAVVSLPGCALMGMDEEGLEGFDQAASDEDRKVYAFFQERFERDRMRSPEFMTSIAMKTRYGEWDDRSDEFEEETYRLTVGDLNDLKAFDRAQLSEQMRVSYDVFKFRGEQRAARHPFRFHDYVISHFEGPHQSVPALLINQHRIDEEADAEAYVARLRGTSKVFNQSVAFLRAQEAKSITLPRFSYELLLADAREGIKGAPFAGEGENAVWADFNAKIDKLDASAETKARLKESAKAALLENYRPAYERFIAAVEDMGGRVKQDHGVSQLPNGAAFYDERIRFHTTMGLKADEIHELGLDEVKRLSAEMTELKAKAGFRGSLKKFYADLRSNPEHFFANTDEGRQAYATRSAQLLASASAALPSVFGVLPKAHVDVKRIEPYREKGLTIAFYDRSSPDGSRPGHVYLNLSDMSKMPKWQMAALIFHEGIPGHHLQIAIAQEATGVPEFRKHLSFTAFIEGWGLYTEYLSKEMGLYKDVLDDVGRIAMELWRACRLVVDTGIHVKGWSRDKAVAYFIANTPLTDDNIRREINRYFVYPGQACAYQLGKNKIIALREGARTRLGSRFDMRRFHDAVLKNGAVPMPVLEEVIAAWSPAVS
jgi:uncharacterized protein (DUF885 family)